MEYIHIREWMTLEISSDFAQLVNLGAVVNLGVEVGLEIGLEAILNLGAMTNLRVSLKALEQ